MFYPGRQTLRSYITNLTLFRCEKQENKDQKGKDMPVILNFSEISKKHPDRK